MTNYKKIIDRIQMRNERVEADKAWETSRTRKGIIILLTYIIITVFLYTLKIPNPFANALIPTVAFFLSTLTLPVLKKWWIRNIYKK